MSHSQGSASTTHPPPYTFVGSKSSRRTSESGDTSPSSSESASRTYLVPDYTNYPQSTTPNNEETSQRNYGTVPQTSRKEIHEACHTRFLVLSILLLLACATIFARLVLPAAPNVIEQIEIRFKWQQELMEHESLLRDIRRYQEQLKRWEAEKNSPHWGEPHGDGFCVAYETRYYSAILTNLPQNHNWVRACYETPMHIHGVKLDSPERCELVGSDVVGHWRVSFNEPQCRTFWSGFWDKGCSQEGSHKRRIETRLENLRREFDWWETCNTTPVQIHGVHYASPAFCYPINGWKGMLALWEIDDQSC